jgi:lipoate-protein ligase A
MSTEWRLLEDDIHEARHHFAVEEALARLVDEGHSPPTLRMRRVRPAVFVGVYQNTWAEVNVAYCRAHHIQIVRRMNGGGAVYHEMGSFCFSAFFGRELFPQSDEELYRVFAVPVIRTCADYGISARFHGRNDVLVGDRKIYGSAQFSWYSAFVQSGTFLVNMDFVAMEHALTPPALKFEGKSARSIRDRVTSLSREVGRELDTREVMKRFANHAADVLRVRLIPGGLTPEERALADELLRVKYSTDDWNFGAQREYQVTVADRSELGVISLSAEMEGEKIQKVRITGDILLSERSELARLESALKDVSVQQAHSAVGAALLPAGIRDSLFRLLARLAPQITGISSIDPKEKSA